VWLMLVKETCSEGKMVKVQCIKCNREGSLTKKQTKSKGITYVYWYIEHHIENKIKWCYLGKYEKLPEEYKSLIHKDTQTDRESNNPNLGFISEVKAHYLPSLNGTVASDK